MDRKNVSRDDARGSGSRSSSRSSSGSRSRNRSRSRSRSHSASSSESPSRDPATPVLPFKNDGSFLEMFKKMQEQAAEAAARTAEAERKAASLAARRRRGKVLKTGLVEKPKPPAEEETAEPSDAWTAYRREVEKYKKHSTEEEGNRLLTKEMDVQKINSAADFKTAPFDPRFPNTNQTRYCYSSYLDYHRCQKVKGKDYEPCNYFKRVYIAMCPNDWTEKWDDQIANGNFAGKI